MVRVMPIGDARIIKLARGFTYIGLLIVIAIAGVGMAAVGTLWKTEMQREREKELLFIGQQFKAAIASYYTATPGGISQFPKTLDDLILDKRFPAVKRHLRKLYADPMTGKSDWSLLKEQDMIIGVYSNSLLKPIKKSGFEKGQEDFGNAMSYSDWHFVFTQGG
jgi:type II secretory pathway pseudopilin PulG